MNFCFYAPRIYEIVILANNIDIPENTEGEDRIHLSYPGYDRIDTQKNKIKLLHLKIKNKNAANKQQKWYNW